MMMMMKKVVPLVLVIGFLCLLSPPVLPAQSANLNGIWMLVDSLKKIDCQMILEQTGQEVRGICKYDNGTSGIAGKISGDSLVMKIIDENPDVIARWVPKSIAVQLPGIASSATFTGISASTELKGLFSGWHVNWTSEGTVTLKADGGTPEALSHNIPRAVTLKRVESPSSTMQYAATLPMPGMPSTPQGPVDLYRLTTSRKPASGYPDGVTEIFNPEDSKIYCFFKFNNVPVGSEISSIWYYLNADPLYKIVQSTVRTSEGTNFSEFSFELDSGKKWPIGRFRIDIYVNGKKEKEVFFSVR